MVNAKDIAVFLNEELKITEFEDASVNGLQVENKQDVNKVGFAVDIGVEVIEKAAASKCQMLIVHHGLIWTGLKSITGFDYLRVKELLENDMALYGAHLPLDAHPKYGNNAVLANMLELKKVKPFGIYNGKAIGWMGETKLTLEEIRVIIRDKGMKDKLLAFGKSEIRNVAIISGRAAFEVRQAIEQGAGLYITGEPIHEMYHMVKEGKINVLLGGHYETEVWGVKALMPVIQREFNVNVEFIDVPIRL